MDKVKVAVVGLGFNAGFLPISRILTGCPRSYPRTDISHVTCHPADRVPIGGQSLEIPRAV